MMATKTGRLAHLFIILTALVVSGVAPAPAAAQTGGITGFVVDTLGGTISGATVEVVSGPTTGRQTVSASNGSYLLSGLNGGFYQFRASRTGFQTRSGNFTVTSGVTSRLDFTLVPDGPQGGVLQGVVSRSDTRGPLEGAEVRLTGGAGLPSAAAETGADGRFRFANLPTGSYRLEVDRDGFTGQARNFTVVEERVTTANFNLQPRSAELGIIQGSVEDANGRNLSNVTLRLADGISAGRSDATNRRGAYQISRIIPDDYILEVAARGFETQRIPVTVAPGRRLVVNVILQVEGVANLEIEGFVIDDFGAPVAGAQVITTAGPRIGRQDLTDSTGFYQLRDLPPGRYTLRATAAGFQNDTETADLTSAEQPLRVDFVVVAGSTQQIGNISGRVTDGDGNGLSGVSVLVTAGPSSGQTALADSDGDYVINNLPAGTYALRFSRSGFVTRTVSGVDVVTRQTTTLNVELTRTTTGTGRLSGTVIDDDTNEVLSGVSVRLTRGTTLIGTASTNSFGGYGFTGLDAGSYGVRFSKSGYTTATRTVTVDANFETVVNIRLVPGAAETGSVAGLVRDNGGHPLQAAEVELSGAGFDSIIMQTDADGRFQFSGIPPGSYVLSVRAAGLTPDEQAITVRAGETTSVTFTLVPTGSAGTISGAVYSSSGIPVPAVVTVVSGPLVGASRNTSSDGRFIFTGLPGGFYTLEARSPNYRPKRVTVFVRAGSTTTTSLFLSR